MKLLYKVKSTDTYQNVQEILKCEFQISERLLHKLKRNNAICLNGQPVFPNAHIDANDEISVIILFDEESDNIVPTKMDLDIIYEDDGYIVLNKPTGIPVHPSMDHYEDSLSNGLKYYFNKINLKRKIRPVNRIDKNTSGLVIFAKNEYVQECFIRQMKDNSFYKEYIAICNGIFDSKSGIINAPIARKENSIIERCINENGDISVTHYEVLQENLKERYSIVRCVLETGRTYQIRVHMQYVGHPLLGDSLYGATSNLIDRQALHAHKCSFFHPIAKKKAEYIAPIPQDMQKLIDNI